MYKHKILISVVKFDGCRGGLYRVLRGVLGALEGVLWEKGHKGILRGIKEALIVIICQN